MRESGVGFSTLDRLFKLDDLGQQASNLSLTLIKVALLFGSHGAIFLLAHLNGVFLAFD